MLKSMTGYGKAECQLPDKKVSIENKSLNSKQIDSNIRTPSIYREKELEIRNLISSKLERGKIECSIFYELSEGAAAQVNKTVVMDYFRQLSAVAAELGLSDHELLLPVAMRMPDSIVSEKNDLDENEWNRVRETLLNAIGELETFRTQEGKSLETDLSQRVSNILERLAKVDQFEEERTTRIKEKLKTSLEEASLREEIDYNRFEQELIYYLEKLDISEEKVRLENHCNYFVEVLSSGSPVGKKLGFISQEMGREINTLGSKANHTEIQRLVVEMKDELEKIKEQVLNVL